MAPELTPTLMPLGDNAVLVRFSETLSDSANRQAIGFARRLAADIPEGVDEIVPGLVSVMLRMAPGAEFSRLAGELRLRMGSTGDALPAAQHTVEVSFDGEDLPEVAELLRVGRDAFVAKHGAAPLRVLATGFAPGFVYCGFHGDDMLVPRRETVRLMVPAGTVLFAAGQTAITATPIRTGWHVIGRTAFQNFDPNRDPPTLLGAGDEIRFTEAP
jgi:KipI family sensor histidine kinase inhibitor